MRQLCFSLLCAATLTGCGERAITYQQATEVAYEQAAELSYADVGSESDCTADCSGHEAGFEWARDNGVTQTWDCPVKGSPSFLEGCEAFAHYVSETIDQQNWEPAHGN